MAQKPSDFYCTPVNYCWKSHRQSLQSHSPLFILAWGKVAGATMQPAMGRTWGTGTMQRRTAQSHLCHGDSCVPSHQCSCHQIPHVFTGARDKSSPCRMKQQYPMQRYSDGESKADTERGLALPWMWDAVAARQPCMLWLCCLQVMDLPDPNFKQSDSSAHQSTQPNPSHESNNNNDSLIKCYNLPESCSSPMHTRVPLATLLLPNAAALSVQPSTFCPTGSPPYFCFWEDYHDGNLQVTAWQKSHLPPRTLLLCKGTMQLPQSYAGPMRN